MRRSDPGTGSTLHDGSFDEHIPQVSKESLKFVSADLGHASRTCFWSHGASAKNILSTEMRLQNDPFHPMSIDSAWTNRGSSVAQPWQRMDSILSSLWSLTAPKKGRSPRGLAKERQGCLPDDTQSS